MAQRERQQMADLMESVGPDAPTLCEGWAVRDLAAHLVTRERRPDAMPGILLPALAGHTERVQSGYAKRDFAALLGLLRSGPPVYSPFWAIDGQANLGEMFIHHEDVRRAREDWQPREMSAKTQDAFWRSLKLIAKRSYRKSPVTIALARDDNGDTATPVHKGGPMVTLRGAPSELLMHAFGRDASRVEFEGASADVAAVRALVRAL